MTKKVCISGYYGFDNFGDETILKLLIENLKKNKNITEVTVFSVNPFKTSKNLNVKSVYTFNPFSVLVSVLNSDCLISGGGSLLQDVTSLKSLIYYLAVIFSAWLFGKKIIIFAQGIGPVNNTLLKKFTVFLLKHAVYISVRDENSLKLLADNNIKNARLCFDPVWNITAEKSSIEGKIGIQLREYPILTENFINILAANINKYYSNKEIYILSLQNNIDLSACNKLKSALFAVNNKLKIQIIENTSNEKVIKDICSLEALISMRYHACLTAIKAGIKVLPVNYDIKVETLAKEFDLICINSDKDINSAFEAFINKNIIYDETKINEKNFDFNELNRII